MNSTKTNPMYVLPLPGQPRSPASAQGTRIPSPTRLPHPFERDKFFVADSDTNVRQMRQISALQIPSPATALSPFVTIFRRSPDTNLPRVRQRFPSWPRYNHETMRQISATKHSPQLRFLSHQLRTLPSPHVFAATKSPGMRQAFRSWLRYNHETTKTTATPSLPHPLCCCHQNNRLSLHPFVLTSPRSRRTLPDLPEASLHAQLAQNLRIEVHSVARLLPWRNHPPLRHQRISHHTGVVQIQSR